MVTTAVKGTGGAEVGGEAPVSFTHGSGQADNDLIFEWDLDGDGDFSASEENITSYITVGQSRIGRDWPSQINGKAGAGRLQLALRNDDDRFNPFNAASPLNTAPFTVGTGRTIRVRTSTSTPIDPVLLAKDRFNGAGVLGADETGLTWTDQTANTWTRDGTGRADPADATSPTVPAVATVDVGTDDCYIQAAVDGGTFGSSIGVVYRFTDINNYGELYFDGAELRHYTTTAGTPTLHETYSWAWFYRPATIGILVNGSNITGYLAGVPVFSGATAKSGAVTNVGIIAYNHRQWVLDFRAWDTVPTTTEGVLWTGDVTAVQPSVDRSHDKTVEITAEGRLAKGADQQIETPAYLFGMPTGIQVGEVLSAAELLQPPGLIDVGDITTGAVHFDRDQALELARRLEETEIGFLYEAQEGWIGYEARSARGGATPAATWSDVVGAQFRYESIELLDWRREIYNRALAGLAPRCMSWSIDETNDSNSTAAAAQNDVTVTMPSTITAGDLLLVVIASTVVTAGRQWMVPHGWKQLSNEGDSIRLRVYAKVALGTEDSSNVTFYDDVTTFAGGLWIAEIFRIPAGEWFGSLDGVVQAPCAVADMVAGDAASAGYKPPTLVVPWGTDPTFFVVARGGLGSFSGGTGGIAAAPTGYLSVTNADQDGASNQFDISFHLATKIDSVETEDPAPFGSEDFDGYLVVCATTIAVRGWNGDPPLGNKRQVLQVDDTVSQDRHDMVRTYPTVPELFGSDADADAYADRVIALYGNDRPLFALTFTANKNEAYRAQAYRRRVGDMIHLTATGDTGMGVDGDYFVESIAHRWAEGGLLWTVTWELSPA
jgi:hypothetical protein